MYRAHQKKRRGYRIKKSGIKDINIDRQILAIRKASVEKLIQYPDLIQQVEVRLEQRLQNGRMRYGEFIHWQSLLMLIDQPDQFRQGILEDSDRMRRLRRRTPLVNILSEAERQAALDADATGYLSTLDHLSDG